MKTLSQLQNEAANRLWEKFTDELRQEVEVTDHNGNKYIDTISVTDEITDFLKSEIKNAIQTFIKETSIEERKYESRNSQYGFSFGENQKTIGFNKALSEINNKQNQFLNN